MWKAVLAWLTTRRVQWHLSRCVKGYHTWDHYDNETRADAVVWGCRWCPATDVVPHIPPPTYGE